MVFYWHFQPLYDLPDPSRLLSASLSPAAIARLWVVRRIEVSKVRATCGSQQGNTAKFILPLSDVLANVKNIYTRSKGAWQLAGAYKIQKWKFLLKALWPFIRILQLPKFPTIRCQQFSISKLDLDSSLCNKWMEGLLDLQSIGYNAPV